MGHAKFFMVHSITGWIWLQTFLTLLIVERRSNFNKTYVIYLEYTTCNNYVGVFINYLCIIFNMFCLFTPICLQKWSNLTAVHVKQNTTFDLVARFQWIKVHSNKQLPSKPGCNCHLRPATSLSSFKMWVIFGWFFIECPGHLAIHVEERGVLCNYMFWWSKRYFLMEVFRCPGIVGSTMVNTPCLDCLGQILVILQHEAVQRTQLTKKANTINVGLEDWEFHNQFYFQQLNLNKKPLRKKENINFRHTFHKLGWFTTLFSRELNISPVGPSQVLPRFIDCRLTMSLQKAGPYYIVIKL